MMFFQYLAQNILLTTMQQIGFFAKPLLYLQGCEMKSEWKHENATQRHTSMQALTKMYQLQSCFFNDMEVYWMNRLLSDNFQTYTD